MIHGGRREGAGRPKGARNRRTLEVEQKLQELDCPFEGMERIAKEAELKGDLSTAGRMYAELACYLAPKRKSVEVSEKKGVGMDLTLDQLGKLKQRILEGDSEIVSVMSEGNLGNSLTN